MSEREDIGIVSDARLAYLANASDRWTAHMAREIQAYRKLAPYAAAHIEYVSYLDVALLLGPTLLLSVRQPNERRQPFAVRLRWTSAEETYYAELLLWGAVATRDPDLFLECARRGLVPDHALARGFMRKEEPAPPRPTRPADHITRMP